MNRSLELGEHTKNIGGREYVYSRLVRGRGEKATTKYEGAVDPQYYPVMEQLSAKDRGIIERAFRDGVAVSTIQNHVWNAEGVHVTPSTIYAYMARHGIKRKKRDVRIDKGRTKMDISASTKRAIIDAWHDGESWQTIQRIIRRESGIDVGRSLIYEYMKTYSSPAKRKAGIKRMYG